jgi:hypothetical protein
MEKEVTNAKEEKLRTFLSALVSYQSLSAIQRVLLLMSQANHSPVSTQDETKIMFQQQQQQQQQLIS